jgi:hypothetical protein
VGWKVTRDTLLSALLRIQRVADAGEFDSTVMSEGASISTTKVACI